MSQYEKSIDLYGDNIGRVDYVSHMGSDLTVVNSARVSFGTTKSELDKRDRKLIRYLIPTSTLLLWSIVLLPINLLCLYSFVLNITVTERGVITKLVDDTQTKNFGFIVHENLEHNTNQTDKPQT